MANGDVLGYYTSERYQMEHISAIIEATHTQWSEGAPLCGRVQSRAVFVDVRRRNLKAELRAIVDTQPRLAFIRYPRCQVIAKKTLEGIA